MKDKLNKTDREKLKKIYNDAVKKTPKSERDGFKKMFNTFIAEQMGFNKNDNIYRI